MSYFFSGWNLLRSAAFGFLTIPSSIFAMTPLEIFEENGTAIVYLAVKSIDATDSGDINRGTGFIVSHDGYVVTVAHIRPGPNEILEATIGQREGIRHRLDFIDEDEGQDLALWKIKQSQACRPLIALSLDPPQVMDAILVAGFPRQLGLTPIATRVANINGPSGTLIVDGDVDRGNSGSPVFNESGKAIAMVRGGHPSDSRNNHATRIGPVKAMLDKHTVAYSVDKKEPYAIGCYSRCRAAENGIERWDVQKPWKQESGWYDGGHNPNDVCAGLIAAWTQVNRGFSVELRKTSEKSKKDVFGHVEYKYYCEGIAKAKPLYKEARSIYCGLWSQTGD